MSIVEYLIFVLLCLVSFIAAFFTIRHYLKYYGSQMPAMIQPIRKLILDVAFAFVLIVGALLLVVFIFLNTPRTEVQYVLATLLGSIAGIIVHGIPLLHESSDDAIDE